MEIDCPDGLSTVSGISDRWNRGSTRFRLCVLPFFWPHETRQREIYRVASMALLMRLGFSRADPQALVIGFESTLKLCFKLHLSILHLHPVSQP